MIEITHYSGKSSLSIIYGVTILLNIIKLTKYINSCNQFLPVQYIITFMHYIVFRKNLLKKDISHNPVFILKGG